MNPNRKNLANAFLAEPLAAAATSMKYAAGYGATKPTVPYFDTLTPQGQLSTVGNSEVVLVTALTGDIATIIRAQKNTTAKDFAAGTIASNGIYAEATSAVGDIIVTLNSNPTPGRLFMDGATHSKSNYPLLYDHVTKNPAYGSTGGSSGSETFTLADMRERMPFGKSSNSPFTTLGGKAGTASETLTMAQIPNASGTMELHGSGSGGNIFNADGVFSSSPNVVGKYGNLNYYAGSQSRTAIVFNLGGGGQAHNNMSPYIIVNYEVVCG